MSNCKPGKVIIGSFLPHHVQLRLAVAADVDPGTLGRYIEGKPVRGRMRERIEKALMDAGYSLAERNGAAGKAP